MTGRREGFGGMELLGRLSAGGMGEVLLARRRGPHGFEKLVAVKTIRCDLVGRDDIRSMFLDEARLMARLDHPAIAQVYDFGEENDVLFIAMEYVPGVVLNRLLKKRIGPLPQAVAARIAIQVAHGLHAAHELVDPNGKPLGVVHRDVSPHNLILSFDGRVKILDFGIALFRDREAPQTEFGVVKGKVSYISPEQLRAQRADRRSDIYSLGIVLHEMLTGKKLFVSTNPVQDLIERENAPAPSKIMPGIVPVLDTIVMKALAVKPEDRFQGARDMALALEHGLGTIPGETVEEFAERELKEERSHQRVRLSSISSGQERVLDMDGAPPALPISISTRDVIALDRFDASARGSARTHDERASSARASSVEPSIEPPSRGPEGRFVYVVLGALFVLFGIFYFTRTSVEPLVPEGRETATASTKTATAVSAALLEALNSIATTTDADDAELEPGARPRRGDEPDPNDPEVAAGAPGDGEGAATPTPETPPIPPRAEATSPGTSRALREEPSASGRGGRVGAPKPARLRGSGTVTIEASPSALVWIDGRAFGLTPIRELRVEAGRHELLLRRPQTRALRWRRTLSIREGQRLRFSVTSP